LSPPVHPHDFNISCPELISSPGSHDVVQQVLLRAEANRRSTGNGRRLAQHLKVWGDRSPFIGQRKGGGLPVEPGIFAIIIASNYAINEAFSKEQDREAIRRRLNQIEMTTANKVLREAMKIDAHI
jgi:hypothetical protein